MRLLRSFLRDCPRLAMLLLAAALCMKALVPAGFMVEAHSSVISVTICGDRAGVNANRAVAEAIRDKLPIPFGDRHGADQSCPYAGLAMASLGGADAPLMVLALAFALALAFLPMGQMALRQAGWLRPPLRGPPAPYSLGA